MENGGASFLRKTDHQPRSALTLSRARSVLGVLLLLALRVAASAVPVPEEPGEPTPEQLRQATVTFAKIGGTYEAATSSWPQPVKHLFLFENWPRSFELKDPPQPPFAFGLGLGVSSGKNPLAMFHFGHGPEGIPPPIPDRHHAEAVARELGRLRNLRALRMPGPEVTDAVLKELGGLVNLTELILYDSPVTDVGLGEVKKLRSLAVLGLRKTKVTAAGLAELRPLTGLTYLDLRDTQVTDAGLKELAAFKALSVLGLSDTAVTEAGLRELRGLKNLKVLGLAGIKVTDTGGKILREFHRLDVLDLRRTEVTEATVAELKRALPDCEIRQ